MSAPIFHASFAFVLSVPFLRLSGLPTEMAFFPAILSMIMDLDASIAPSERYESAFHSLWALLAVMALPLAASMLSFDTCIAFLPAIAVLAHLFQDIISGELDIGDSLYGIGMAWTFMPRLSRALDVVSLPLVLVLMLL
ncbi:MAG: hypothetical protein LLG16_04750 [Euryarchaeota archaeon]|nr:hypothetical protein [Euryarchaeota archaeon]